VLCPIRRCGLWAAGRGASSAPEASGGGWRLRAVLAAVSLVFVVTVCLPSAAAADNKKKPQWHPPPPRDLSDQVDRLARQLLSVPLDESEAITGQIQQLVVSHLQDWLSHPTPASGPRDVPFDVRIRQEMEKAFSGLQYPLFGQPLVFSQPWKGAVLIGASYTLGWSDYDRANVIALFETRDGTTRLAGLDHFVPRTDLHYAFLTPTDPTSFRFLVFGTRLGKSQPRLSAILYGYDGQTLKSLWAIRDYYDGKLETDKDTVVVRYLKEDEYIRELTYNRKPPRHLAVYKASAQGLTLISDREIPF